MNQNYNGMQQNNGNQNNNSVNSMPANNLQASVNQPMQNQSVQQAMPQNVMETTVPQQQPAVQIVETGDDKANGQDKCPKCGATGAKLNVAKGVLVCTFCRHEFQPEKVAGMVEDLSQLQGQVIGSGATNIVADTKDVLTLKCSSCGAEVVIDTASSTNARCHWCRNTLSINQKVPNGAVPDVVLPFHVKKDEARLCIEKFVGSRKFFAHPKFQKEFTTENIMGVYFPYMVVDVNAHSDLIGEGEHQTRRYTVKKGDHYDTYYDADLYHVERNFDITIAGLTVESSADKLNNQAKDKTNNIINSILPFDIENSVKYNAGYLRGFTSEKRDVNIDDLRVLVSNQSKDIARFAANDSIKFYDRGVKWNNEQINIKGQQWKAAYLPVWLYSYQEVNGDKKLLHYVAVNARTKETMGSVPIHMPKLIGVSALVELIGFLSMLWIDFDYNWIFLLLGFAFFFIMYSRYRNAGARHHHETETKRNVSNMITVDNFIKHEKGLSNSSMSGANNRKITGATNLSFADKISQEAKQKFNIKK